LRQWVLSLPHALRFLLATDPDALTLVLAAVYRTISRHLIGKAGLTRATGVTGAVTLVQRIQPHAARRVDATKRFPSLWTLSHA